MGSYECSCKSGYKLADDKHKCEGELGCLWISRAKTKFRSDWDACGYMTLRRSIISIGVPVDTSSKDAV